MLSDQYTTISGHNKRPRFLNRLFHRLVYRTAWTDHHVRNTFIPRPSNSFRPHALRSRMLKIYAGALVGSKILVVAFVAIYAGPAQVSDVTPANIIRLTNEARVANKLPALKTNALLTKAAQAKANDMIRQQYFAHISPSNLTPWSFFKQAGYSYRYAGENLAIDFTNSEDIIKAWLNSPSHRTNLLSSRYTEIGVAVVSGKINGVQSLLVVQMFGTPIKPVIKKSTAPTQTPSPQVVKDQLAQANQPTVLGETEVTPVPEATPTPVPVVSAQPPPPPTIDTPADQTIVQSAKPEIVGSAQAGSTITLSVDGQPNATTETNAAGVYALTPSAGMAEGSHTIATVATANGLSSAPSSSRSIVVDTVPPTIDEQGTYALFSILAPDTFDVSVMTSPGTTGVDCSCGGVITALHQNGQTFQGQVRLAEQAASSGVLGLTVRDLAGNEIKTALIDSELFTNGAVEPITGPIVTALNLIFVSRAFMLAFMAVMFLLAMINIIVHWERQHRPTIVGSLLLIYLAGSLLFI